MTNLNEAIQLISQEREDEARHILETILQANPQDIQAWFWYAETCSTNEQRINLLEICLKANPGNLQVLRALRALQARQSRSVLVQAGSSRLASRSRPSIGTRWRKHCLRLGQFPRNLFFETKRNRSRAENCSRFTGSGGWRSVRSRWRATLQFSMTPMPGLAATWSGWPIPAL